MVDTMKAIVKPWPAPGAEIKEVPIPAINPNELLVKVLFTSICGTDLHIYNWNDWAKSRIKPPLIHGHEFVGEVVETGKLVESIKKGDIVTSETHLVCTHCELCTQGLMHVCENTKILGVDINGCFAEYIAIPGFIAWKIGKNVPINHSSIYEPFGNSVHATLIEPVSAKDVAVFGVGPTGLFSVAIARFCGASKIIAIDINKYRLDIAKKVGADVLINASHQNPIKIIMNETNNKGVDVSLEMSGAPSAVKASFQAVKKAGRISLFGIPSQDVSLNIPDDIIFKGIRIYGVTGRQMFKTWHEATALLSNPKLNIDPIMTHELPFEEFEKGMELMNKGLCGKVVLKL